MNFAVAPRVDTGCARDRDGRGYLRLKVDCNYRNDFGLGLQSREFNWNLEIEEVRLRLIVIH